MFRRKVSMVYYIASKMGKTVDYKKACKIADHFTIDQLDRLYRIAAPVTKGSNVIGIGSKPSDLTGRGLEYLAPNGMVIAKFFDGNLITDQGAKVDAKAKTVIAG